MAFQITEVQPSGVSITYWSILITEFNYGTSVLTVTLAGYLDSASKTGGKTPVGTMRTMLSGADFVPDATRAQIYDALKLTQDWTGAKDA